MSGKPPTKHAGDELNFHERQAAKQLSRNATLLTTAAAPRPRSGSGSLLSAKLSVGQPAKS